MSQWSKQSRYIDNNYYYNNSEYKLQTELDYVKKQLHNLRSELVEKEVLLKNTKEKMENMRIRLLSNQQIIVRRLNSSNRQHNIYLHLIKWSWIWHKLTPGRHRFAVACDQYQCLLVILIKKRIPNEIIVRIMKQIEDLETFEVLQ
jgi:hypothetical protein